MTEIIEFPKERSGMVEARQDIRDFIFALALEKHIEGLKGQFRQTYDKGFSNGMAFGVVMCLIGTGVGFLIAMSLS